MIGSLVNVLGANDSSVQSHDIADSDIGRQVAPHVKIVVESCCVCWVAVVVKNVGTDLRQPVELTFGHHVVTAHVDQPRRIVGKLPLPILHVEPSVVQEEHGVAGAVIGVPHQAASPAVASSVRISAVADPSVRVVGVIEALLDVGRVGSVQNRLRPSASQAVVGLVVRAHVQGDVGKGPGGNTIRAAVSWRCQRTSEPVGWGD